MILYLVRHGIAVDREDPQAPSEPERPLTAKGVQKTRAAALGLQSLHVKPDVLITSPYVRAAQPRKSSPKPWAFRCKKSAHMTH